MNAVRALVLSLLVLTSSPLLAQHVHGQPHDEDGATDFLLSQASGTASNPEASSMPMFMGERGPWHWMLHGVAFLNRIEQEGPRGSAEKTFSTNWVMASVTRSYGASAIMFRSMLSLEPATISDRKYPLLFQTGETAFGRPIIDGQHPHDFFMELATEYARKIGPRRFLSLYVAPVGDPAIGPVAFPHRASAAELPQAVISHHYQDSTHIASAVITGGITWGIWRLEGSAFHGREPDEQRWDLDGGAPDSWSGRLSITPTRRLTAQVSAAYITRPEKVEPGDQKRRTASVSYTIPFRGGEWASSGVWGQTYNETHDNTLNSWLAESLVRFMNRNALTMRWEQADKDELFPHSHGPKIERPPIPVPTFRVQAATVGYTFDVITSPIRAGIGASYTIYRYPTRLEPFYGKDARTTMLFVRLGH